MSADYSTRFAAASAELEEAMLASAAKAAGVDVTGLDWALPDAADVAARARRVVGEHLAHVELSPVPEALLTRLPDRQRQQLREFEAAWPGLAVEARPGAFVKYTAVLRNWGAMHLPKGNSRARGQLKRALDHALAATGQSKGDVVRLTALERREQAEASLRALGECLADFSRFFC